MEKRRCQIVGCLNKYYAKGFCAKHYQKNRLQQKEKPSASAFMEMDASLEIPAATEQEKQTIGRFTGMVRELDSLGRIVLPIELRRVLDIEISDGLEIFVDQEMIILRKYSPGCIFCGNVMNDTVYFKGKIVCKECMNNCKSDS